MPSGYTADLYDGKPQTFEEFAMSCARAFGALVMMRDDGPGTAITDDKLVIPDSSGRRVAEAKTRLARIHAMTDDEIAREAAAEHMQAVAAYEESHRVAKERRHRYELMLADVKAWRPPTKDHEGLKAFMEQQLLQSINYDGEGYPRTRPVMRTIDEWRSRETERCLHDIEYYSKRAAETADLNKSRIEWVRKLRESLKSKEVA